MMNSAVSGPYRSYGARPVTPLPGAETKRESAETDPRIDVMEVSGRTPRGAGLSVEQAMGRLHELGLLTSASRPLSPDIEPEAAAALTVDLGGPGAPPEEAAADGTAAEEEWHPYLPPGAPPPEMPEGNLVTLTLFPPEEESGDLLLDLGAFTIPLDADGELLAMFADGAFRSLSLNQDLLDLLLSMGQATVLELGAGTTEVPPEAPERAEAGAPPPEAAPPETRAETPDAARALSESETAAPPEAARALAAPESAPDGTAGPSNAAEAAPGNAAARETPPAAREPDFPLNLPGAPPAQPRALAGWAAMRAVAGAFQGITERWERETEQPDAPEARQRLGEQRQAWVDSLPRADRSAFRAWVGLHVAEKAASGDWDGALKPSGLTRQAYEQWLRQDAAAEEADEGDIGVRWLRSHASRALASEESLAVQRSLYHAQTVSPEQDDLTTLLRKISAYMERVVAGNYRHNTKAQADSLELPERPKRTKEELEKAWKRRQIAHEVDSDWTRNLKTWLTDVDGRVTSECQAYINDRVNEWTTGLMRNEPARFRLWLSSPVRRAAGAGWFNEATGSFPIETLPRGFTDADFHRWMQLDALDLQQSKGL